MFPRRQQPGSRGVAGHCYLSATHQTMVLKACRLMQARFCKPLPENAAVVDALTLLAKYEGSLAADQTPNATPGQDSFNRRVCRQLPSQRFRAGGLRLGVA